jgi:hypothetical protein
MKQKPVFLKHLTYIVSIASLLFPTANLLHLNSIIFSNEGNHPKNVNLAEPDFIICVPNLFLFVNNNCDSIIIKTPTPKSDCSMLDSLSYQIDGGPVIQVPLSSGVPPDSIVLGKFGVDTIRVDWWGRDLCTGGTSGGCIQEIRIRDTLKPTPICKNLTIDLNNTGDTVLTAAMFDNGSTDNCGAPLTFSTIPSNLYYSCDSVASSPRPVTLIVTDKSGNTATCSASVTVRDLILPTITCPANVTINVDANQCYATNVISSLGQPITNDNCLPVKDTLRRFNGDTLRSNTQLPVGNNTIVWIVTDKNNNTNSCSQTVTIRDNILPSISCPANITVTAAGNACTANATYTTPVGTDNCPGANTVRTSGLPSGASYPIGVTTNIFTVTDAAGNSAACSFTVTVRDTVAPTITCPSNITVNAANGTCAANVNYTAPTGTDLCSGSNTTQTAGMASGASFPVGQTTNTFRVTDASGNTATCSFTVTVVDNQIPTISCPADMTVFAQSGSCSATVNYTPPVGTDNCTGVVTTLIGGPASGAVFSVGTTAVTYRVTAANGASATCSFNITVRDIDLPSIACPTNITMNVTPGTCASVVTYTAPIGTDLCSGATTIQTSGLASGATFPLGVTTNTFRVTDASGNTATCSFTVTVLDAELPTINCPANITVNAVLGTCAATVTYTAPVGTDLCTGAATMQTSGLPSGASFPVGTTTNVFRVTDASNNSATCSFTVTVRDVQLPSIMCPANITANAANGTCTANVSYTAPVGTDLCSTTPITVLTSGIVSGGSFPVGTTTNVFTVTDSSGNSATCSFTVTVFDNQLPVINCPGDVTVNTLPGACTATVTYTAPVGTDNCPGDTTFRVSGLASGSVFPLGMNTITYRVRAANGDSATCSFKVIVRDLQPPTISCPAVDSVTLNNQCSMLVPDLRSKITINDNCQIDTLIQSPAPGTTIASSHNQQHIFTFTVTDEGGLFASCTTTVTAKDKLGPDIVCIPKRLISISSQPKLSAQSFVTSASDGCPGDLIYKVRRMSSGMLQDSVTYTCDDVNDTILMVIRVSDLRGNFTECMDTVIVQDLLTPFLNATLPDVTISCEYPLNINNLSAFGTYNHVDSVRLTNVINDPGNTSSPTRTFQNGVYSENCPGTTVIISTINQLNMCNNGEIKRVFAIRDAAGNILRDTQSIFVMDFNKFSISDITWPPAQVDYFDCQRAIPDTAVTKSPVIRNDNCSKAAATFVDQAFNNPAYCKAIIRKWTVIDWCQYQTNTNNSPGKFTFDQLIIIRDTIAPLITSACRDSSICTPFGDCSASVTFSATGTDNCSAGNSISWVYKIDLGNNGGSPDITGTGSAFTRTIGLGTHRLTWEAKDPCGNTKTCTFLFTIRDCKAPSLVVLNGLATSLMPGVNMIQVKAKAFDNLSSDNCTPANQLKFSYSSSTNDTIRTFTCDSMGSRNVEIWLTDNAGNQTKTRTRIDIQDPHNTCPANLLLNISGSVYTENGKFIPDVNVNIDGGETEKKVVTDKEGRYTFKDLAKLNDYEIVPEKNTGHLDGVTTLDLVIIQRHILGLKTLESPFKLIAADINNSKSITAADLLELRKVVLGLENEFKNNTSWRFVDAGQRFEDINYPWIFRSNIQYSNLEQNMVKTDFIGVKIGDVNGSVVNVTTQENEFRTSEKAIINIEDTNLNAGEMVFVPVNSDMTDQLVGVQWTMEIKSGLVYTGIESAEFDISDEHVGIIEKDGKTYVTISYHHVKDINSVKKELFKLVFKANKDGALRSMLKFSGDITPALAVTKNLEEKKLAFEFRTKVPEEAFIAQNQPNPFRGETVIHLALKKASMTEISIFDAKGSAIYNGIENFSQGLQSMTIGEKQLGNQTGVFYCRIKNNEVNQVIKMLRIE